MINYHMNKYMEEKFITIKKFLKNGKKKDNAIFVAKTTKSIIIGPYTANNFKYDDFHKRLTANCLYNKHMYKNISIKKINKIINANKIKIEELTDTMLEYCKNGEIVRHQFINIPK